MLRSSTLAGVNPFVPYEHDSHLSADGSLGNSSLSLHCLSFRDNPWSASFVKGKTPSGMKFKGTVVSNPLASTTTNEVLKCHLEIPFLSICPSSSEYYSSEHLSIEVLNTSVLSM